jgi:hypothetical protein
LPGHVAAHFTPGLQAQAREAEMMIPLLLLGIPALFAHAMSIFAHASKRSARQNLIAVLRPEIRIDVEADRFARLFKPIPAVRTIASAYTYCAV